MKMLSSTLLTKSVRKVARSNIITLSQTSFSTLTSESLPPNVTIVGIKGKPADLSFLKLEKKETLKSSPTMEYLFPLLSVPKTLEVMDFENPGLVVDSVPIDSKIFGVALRKDIVLDVVRYQRHKMRQPKKTKRINEISGSKKKPRPQKGGGASQVGNKRNSAWRGGQKAHGPVIRDYSIDLNRKYRAMGMMIVLAAKFREGNLIVFNKLECKTHKTKDAKNLLIQHGLETEINSTLFVDEDFQREFLLATSNIPLVLTLPQNKANVYDIMKKDKMVITAKSLQLLQERVLAQYSHSGKRKAVHSRLHMYETIVNHQASVETCEV